MTIRDIKLVPDPVLRQKAKKVPKVTPATQTLIDDMIETMRVAPGVGLAAPQIGVLQRVLVVEVPKNEEDPKAQHGLYALVNPEIVAMSEEQAEGLEGCLSIPGYQGDVERHIAIEVRALSREGKKVRLKATDYLARVLQHEVDHLDGVLFLDRLTSSEKLHKVEASQQSVPAGG